MMMIGVVFTVCIIKCTVALILFSFWITRTSVNADILGWSKEVRANKVLLFSKASPVSHINS